MTFSFRPAVRENVGLLIGISGGTGSGKTCTALELATGLADGEPFCGIDTENGRMLHYADQFNFDHGHLKPPFRPMAYAEAIEKAVEAGYKVIIVDSASHEHAGDGGLLDWHEEELDRMAGTDWKKRDRVKMAAWITPKGAHKKMVTRLLSLPPGVHVILCFRAEQKIEMVKEGGRTKIVEKKSPVGSGGWIPVCEKTLPYEMTLSFLLTAENPGVPIPIKLQEQHKPCLDLTKPVTRETGKRLAEWAAGGKKPSAAPQPRGRRDGTITAAQSADLDSLLDEVNADVAKFLAHFKIDSTEHLPVDKLKQATAMLEAKRK